MCVHENTKCVEVCSNKKAQSIDTFFNQNLKMCFYDVLFKFYNQFRCDLTPHMCIIKSILFLGSPVLVKCVGVGAAKLSRNAHVRCVSVQSEKLLCAECAGVPKLVAHKYSVNMSNTLF